MKLSIKQYEYEKIEIASIDIDLPTETSYYFETGIRRSIRVVPIFTNYLKERFGRDEEFHSLEVTCVYQSSELWVEKFTVLVKDIEEIYYSEKGENKRFVDSLVNGWFDKRTKEQFDADLEFVLNTIKA